MAAEEQIYRQEDKTPCHPACKRNSGGRTLPPCNTLDLSGPALDNPFWLRTGTDIREAGGDKAAGSAQVATFVPPADEAEGTCCMGQSQVPRS